MTKIVRFDRATAKTIGTDAAKALEDFSRTLGLEVSYAGGKFSDATFTANVRFTVADTDAREAAERKAWNENCDKFGLEPKHYRHQFAAQNKLYRAVGFKNGKYCILVEEADTGKRVAFTDLVVNRILG